MLKAGAQSTKWPSLKTDKKEQPTSPSSSTTIHRHGSDESDNEDKVPVPEFHSSFGSAIEAAFENIGSKNGKMQSSSSSFRLMCRYRSIIHHSHQWAIISKRQENKLKMSDIKNTGPVRHTCSF